MSSWQGNLLQASIVQVVEGLRPRMFRARPLPTKAEAYFWGGIFGMNEPTITCPHCNAEITLTESLAAPLIRATRKKIAEKEAESLDAKARSQHSAPNSPGPLSQSSNSSLPDSRPSERGLRQRRPRRRNFVGDRS